MADSGRASSDERHRELQYIKRTGIPSTKVKEESDNFSPPRKLLIIEDSSSTGHQSSTSTSTQSRPEVLDEAKRYVDQRSDQSRHTSSFSVYNLEKSYKDRDTSSNIQHEKGTDYPLRFSDDLSVKSLPVTPSSSRPISNTSVTHKLNEMSCPFERNKSSGHVTLTSNKDDCLSRTTNSEKPKNDHMDDLPGKNVDNLEKHSCLNPLKRSRTEETQEGEKTMASLKVNKSMHESTCSTSPDELVPICDDEISGKNVNDISNNGNQLLQEDPSLRQFQLLDELEESDQEDGGTMASNSGESGSELSAQELPIDDIDEMLDEGLPEKFKNKEVPTKLKQKVVLEEKGHDHFDLLPEGWIQIIHKSGMPVYLNRKYRVCTMGRPYYLGTGSSRNHHIPLSAIPCLHYKRASEIEKKKKEEIERKKQSQIKEARSEIELMSADIETFEENKATHSLEASEVHEYCKNLFEFKTLNLMPFKSWADRRKYIKMKKDMQKKQRPTLPGETKLLKFPIQNPDGSKSKGEWIINPNGKSFVCILHEYVQHALKKHPKYEFKELENPATPYSAKVFIDNMEYGFGLGASKKHAKVEAAKVALEVLIPGMKSKVESDGSGPSRMNDTGVSIFDEIEVEDPRVAEFCAKSTEPPPYTILTTCLNRNTGVDRKIEIDYVMGSKGFKSDEYTMTVGDHKATVACRNKREGKQRAAQAILKALHPNITYWGSLLRMYGNRSIKNIKEKKKEEQEITQLQSKASINQPNFAILNKLKEELMKLKAKRESVKAKGEFVLPENIVLPSLSSTDLNKVNISNK